ncbi:ABC-2 type transporter-domain-containing protein [Limtongia smithiae]|uniref:ABC-2 type transporter-domain-containing protein n=1 Tax=Limtongia smithiae TaxID=1125753 RepID=UPI0034CDF863
MSGSGTPANLRPAVEDGRWGEDQAGPGVDIAVAQLEFEELRRELSRVSAVRTNASTGVESQLGSEANLGEQPPVFDLESWIRNDTAKDRQHGVHPKRIGVSFRNLSVTGLDAGANMVYTFTDAIIFNMGGFALDLIRTALPILRPKPRVKKILHDFTGLVRAGEMLLVLGPPGSGTTTFLKALTNKRSGYVSVDGDILYDGIDPKVAHEQFRGEIVFNDEDDRHFSTLTVAQTLRFALSLKTPRTRPNDETEAQFVEKLLELYIKMFAIEHTVNTFVGGDSKARGVSGGERKRVSIAEVLANRAAIAAFDNSTRGLDSSTAVDYIRSLRVLTNVTHSTTIVTLYQAGEGIYKEFDKVCLIYSGHQIFFGPANEARQYFEDLGFEAPPLITTADFLTSITQPRHRQIKAGWTAKVPQTPEELEAAFKASKYYAQAVHDVDEYEAELHRTQHASADLFTKAVTNQRSKAVGKRSPYTVSIFKQIRYLIQRELQLQWQDQTLLKIKLLNSVTIGFIIGSLFYNTSNETKGAFNRGGIMFFSVVFNGWLLQVESGSTILQRPLHNKHRGFGMFRPAALSVAKTISDLPIVISQILIYLIIVYFLADLQRTPGQFFAYCLFVIVTTVTLMSFYRFIAAFSNNLDACLRLVSSCLNALAFWTGYVRPVYKMPWWYRWVYYINPITYGFEALMANEFHGREMLCSSDQLVPAIDGVSIENQACTLPGSVSGSKYVNGDSYIETEFQYSHAHMWRNLGILFGYFAFFLVGQMIFSEILTYDSSSGQVKQFVKMSTTIEDDVSASSLSQDDDKICEKRGKEDKEDKESTRGELFTFREVNFTVPTADGDKQLLHDIEGYAMPGKLLALMGPSGAGKTTLLNTISQRMRIGYVSGDYLMNGYPLPVSFQRTTGFVEQADLHEAKQSIREALRFSARLRQPAHVSLKEKYDYVEEIIRLLELGPIADAIIDVPGSGLSVEERKRVTIGVELAAKPKLLFLDEPTSGLDSEGSLSIVSFIRRLAMETNLAMICTIHQPSAILMSKFDSLLLLARGGRTVYFGPIGDNGNSIIEYFSRKARPPELDSNPAEYILEVIGAGKSSIDWPKTWIESPEFIERKKEIADLIDSRKKMTIIADADDGREYAAPLLEQIRAVTMRLWLIIYRTSSLGYSFVFSALATGLTAGVLFFQNDASILGMQSRIFTLFFTLLVIIPVVNSLEINFIFARDLYEMRERNSKVYSWVALVTAYLVVPLPYMVIISVLFFFPMWYMPDLGTGTSAAGYGYFMILLMQLWHSASAIALGAFVPSPDAAGVINPFFFVITQIITGITIPQSSMNGFYSYFIYWANPVAYAIRGMGVVAEHGVEVTCTSDELAIFTPPAGYASCSDYAGAWVESSTYGKLLNPNATENCEFCQYTVGDDYLRDLGWEYSSRWRDLGLYIMFTGVSFVVPYFAYYIARQMDWSRFTRPFKNIKKVF